MGVIFGPRSQQSAIKPAAITKARVAAGVNPSASSMAITIGVRINAAPSRDVQCRPFKEVGLVQ